MMSITSYDFLRLSFYLILLIFTFLIKIDSVDSISILLTITLSLSFMFHTQIAHSRIAIKVISSIVLPKL